MPRSRLGVSAAFFAQGFAFAVVLTHLAAFETRWGLDDLAITIIMFVVAILAAVGSVLAGVLAARYGSAAALRIGLGAIVVALAIAASAPVFPVFLAGLALYGVGLGCVDATTNMQAVAAEELAGRSILTSFYAAWSVGGILGALETSGTAALGWSLGPALAIAVLPALATIATPLVTVGAAAAVMRLPEPTGADGAPSLAHSKPAGVHIASDGAVAEPLGTSYAVMRIPWKTLAILGLAIVLFYVADSATQSWSTIYLQGVLAASATVAPLGYAAYQVASLVSRVGGDFVVRRLGPVPVVRIAAGVGVVGLLLAVLAGGPVLAIVGFAVLGLGLAVVAPLTFAAAGRLADAQPGARTDPALRRRAADAIIARINQFNYVGFVLGGVLTGLVASASDMRTGFVVPLIGIALIIPIAHVFGGRVGRR